MVSANPSPLVETSRIQSIDIFRGLTVLVMIFVDNLGMVRGLPWWTYHLPREANGMTYVDMVFPAFLFLAGMSIPLAIQRRIAGGEPPARIWLHVLTRSLSLVVLGLFIANAPQLDPQRTHINPVIWALAGFVGIGLGWNAYPPSRLYRTLKYAGVALLLGLLALFRRVTPEGHTAWLDFSDWEILGLIGWAYLLVSTVYLLIGRKLWGLLASLAGLVAINVLSTLGWLQGLNQLPVFLRPFEAGLASITMSGVIAAGIFLEDTFTGTLKKKIWWSIFYAVGLAIAARSLAPLGISKLRDTPAWCLYCGAANILIFLLLYWIADVGHKAKWTTPFRTAAGTNALLPYLLAYVAYFTPQLSGLTADGTAGWMGVAKSFAFTLLVLAVSFILTRLGLRLKL